MQEESSNDTAPLDIKDSTVSDIYHIQNSNDYSPTERRNSSVYSSYSKKDYYDNSGAKRSLKDLIRMSMVPEKCGTYMHRVLLI